MPDKVLICSKPREDHASKGIFNNRQFKDFFGKDITKPKTKERGGKAQRPMNIRIFKPYDEVAIESSFDRDQDNMFSLNQILAKHLAEKSIT